MSSRPAARRADICPSSIASAITSMNGFENRGGGSPSGASRPLLRKAASGICFAPQQQFEPL